MQFQCSKTTITSCQLCFTLLYFSLLSTTVFAEGAKISLKGEGIKIKQGETQFQIKARMMWDYDTFDGIHNDGESGSDSELRHTRLTFKSKLNNALQAKLQIDFDQDDETTSSVETGVGDAYIQYTGWDYFWVTVGRAKEPFGLERMSSSRYITTIERSMATGAFAPGRNIGVGLSGNADNMTWAVGLYQVNEEDEEEENHNDYGITAQLTHTPWHGHNNLLHLGIAGSVRNFGGKKYQIKERAEVHTAEKIVKSAKILADKVNLFGLEAAWVKGSFSLQTEYMMAVIKAETEAEDVNYAGYYLQSSYFLTGESRSYKKGRFGKIKPNAKSGAYELLARYSVLDAVDNNAGVEATNITLGINYYMNEQARLMANYINTELSGEDSDESGNAFSFRIQYSF